MTEYDRKMALQLFTAPYGSAAWREAYAYSLARANSKRVAA